MDLSDKMLAVTELENVSAGTVDTGAIAMSGLSGGAAYGAVGASIGAIGGPFGSLLGGMIGFGFGVVGGVYSYFE